jgi:uncharacterized UBP type Zn finger protein
MNDILLPAANYNFQATPATAVASEDSISALTSMGFPREAVVQALRAANNDIQVATNILLDHRD